MAAWHKKNLLKSLPQSPPSTQNNKRHIENVKDNTRVCMTAVKPINIKPTVRFFNILKGQNI